MISWTNTTPKMLYLSELNSVKVSWKFVIEQKAEIKVDMYKEKLHMPLISTAMSKCAIKEQDELFK